MSTFSEEKFKITRRIPPLQSMRSIDHVTKFHLLPNQKIKQFLFPNSTSDTLTFLTQMHLDLKLTEEIKRNSFSSESRNSSNNSNIQHLNTILNSFYNTDFKKNSISGFNDEKPQSNPKLREIGKYSSYSSQRTSERLSPNQNDTMERRQHIQTTPQLNPLTIQDTCDSLFLRNYYTGSDESRCKSEMRNSLPTSPTQYVGKPNLFYSKQKLKLESEEKEQIVITPTESSLNEQLKYQPGRKNLLLQRAQLQKLDHYFNKQDDVESENFIKEEEEDDYDDVGFPDSQERKNNAKQIFQESENELSIIKERAKYNSRQPLTQQNIFKVQKNQILAFKQQQQQLQGHKFNPYIPNDIASMLHELDLQDTKIKVLPAAAATTTTTTTTTHFAFHSLKKSINFKKNSSSAQLSSTYKKLSSPFTENIPPIYRQSTQPINNQQKQNKLRNTILTNNFFADNNQVSTKQSYHKQRTSFQDVNYIMNQNYLQDIKDLKKKLQKQSSVLKALKI